MPYGPSHLTHGWMIAGSATPSPVPYALRAYAVSSRPRSREPSRRRRLWFASKDCGPFPTAVLKCFVGSLTGGESGHGGWGWRTSAFGPDPKVHRWRTGNPPAA